MNKLLKIIVSFAMICSLLPLKNIYALETDEIIEAELEVAIIAGDGSFDNPYIIDPLKAPEFNEFLKESGREALVNSGSITVENNGASSRAIGDLLHGQYKGSLQFGGAWERTSGGMSVVNNGNVTMEAVTYLSADDVEFRVDNYEEEEFIEAFIGLFPSIYDDSFATALSVLADAGFNLQWAVSMMRFAGIGATIYSVTLFAAELRNKLDIQPFMRAYANGNGVLHAQFKTAYNGSWYSQILTDEWTNYPNVYLPNSSYGSGSFTAWGDPRNYHNYQ